MTITSSGWSACSTWDVDRKRTDPGVSVRSPVDFRKAHDGLCAVVRNEFDDDPFSDDIFVFFNKARGRIKLLVWDRNGFWLHYKRLEKGRFPVRQASRMAQVEMRASKMTGPDILDQHMFFVEKLRPLYRLMRKSSNRTRSLPLELRRS